MDFEADQHSRTLIERYLSTNSMVHRTCSERWTLTKLSWTSSPVRNQATTRIQIGIYYQASFGFEFAQTTSERLAIAPSLPVDPSARTIREHEARNARKRQSSPALSTIPPKRRCATQTDVHGTHMDQVERMYMFFMIYYPKQLI